MNETYPDAVSSDVITGEHGLLDKMTDTIGAACEAAWPYIATIVGVAVLFYIGRALLRAVRSYFGTAS